MRSYIYGPKWSIIVSKRSGTPIGGCAERMLQQYKFTRAFVYTAHRYILYTYTICVRACVFYIIIYIMSTVVRGTIGNDGDHCVRARGGERRRGGKEGKEKKKKDLSAKRDIPAAQPTTTRWIQLSA